MRARRSIDQSNMIRFLKKLSHTRFFFSFKMASWNPKRRCRSHPFQLQPSLHISGDCATSGDSNNTAVNRRWVLHPLLFPSRTFSVHMMLVAFPLQTRPVRRSSPLLLPATRQSLSAILPSRRLLQVERNPRRQPLLFVGLPVPPAGACFRQPSLVFPVSLATPRLIPMFRRSRSQWTDVHESHPFLLHGCYSLAAKRWAVSDFPAELFLWTETTADHLCYGDRRWWSIILYKRMWVARVWRRTCCILFCRIFFDSLGSGCCGPFSGDHCRHRPWWQQVVALCYTPLLSFYIGT